MGTVGRRSKLPAKRAKTVNYSKRYAGNYKHTCKVSHQSTGGYCSWCLARKSEENHHVRYKDSIGCIRGREIPGIDVFPLCLRCHDVVAHSDANWVRVKDNPELNNHNTPEFIDELSRRYKLAVLLKG